MSANIPHQFKSKIHFFKSFKELLAKVQRLKYFKDVSFYLVKFEFFFQG